jgi:hypothetical protein
MFPRTALVIVVLLLLVIAGVFVRATLVARHEVPVVQCERNVVQPYQRLLHHMRELADAGKCEELRAVIRRAENRGTEIGQACSGAKQDAYVMQVGELTP